MNNRITIIGNVAQDPQLRSTSSGKSVLQLRLAETLRFGQREETNYHTLVSWEKQAETMAKYLKKGDQIIVDGTLRYRDYLDREQNKHTVTEILVNNFEFGRKKQTEQASEPDPFKDYAEEISEEELPF